jgi:hypothetical protein
MAKTYKFDYVKLGYTWARGKEDSGFTLNWSAGKVGFGQLTFWKQGAKTTCETETMSQDFIKQAVKFWLKSLEYKDV